MGSQMRFATVLSVLTVSLVPYLGVVTCEAANRSHRSIDSGQPSDLINQPACWTPEQSDDWRHCDIAGKI